MKNKETRWVVTYKRGREKGLYVGQYLTRKDAIEDHIRSKGFWDGKYYNSISLYADQKELSKIWKYWYRKGDRVVKAQIIY